MTRLIIHREGREPEAFALATRAWVGGDKRDDIVLAGLPRAAFHLESSPVGAIATARISQIRGVNQPLAPGDRRLVRPGETIVVSGYRIDVIDESPREGTLALAGVLLQEVAAGTSPMVAPYLVGLTGVAAGKRFALAQGRQVLGRGKGVEICIADPIASRCHAAIVVDGGVARFADLGSKNASVVAGAPVRNAEVVLEPGAEMAIGATRLAYVAVPDEVASEAPAADASVPLVEVSPLKSRAVWTAVGILGFALALGMGALANGCG